MAVYGATDRDTHVVSAYLLSHYTMQLLTNSLRKNAWYSVRAKVVTLWLVKHPQKTHVQG